MLHRQAPLAFSSVNLVSHYCCKIRDSFNDCLEETRHLISYATSWNKSSHAHAYKTSSIRVVEMFGFSVGAKSMWTRLLNLSLDMRTQIHAHPLLSGRWIISWCFLAGSGLHWGERPAKLFCPFFVMSHEAPPPLLLYDTTTGSFSPCLSSCIHGHHSAGPPLLCWGETPINHPDLLALTIWLHRKTPTKSKEEREKNRG